MKLVLNNYFSKIKSTEAFEAAFDDAWDLELSWMKTHAKLEQLRLYVANDIELSPELEEFYRKWTGKDI